MFSFSVSLSSSFLSFFLPVFLFCFILLPCFCLFNSFSFFFAFASWKEQHQNIKLQSFPSSIFFFFWGGVPVLFSLWNPFFLSLFSPDFQLCVWFNINVFGFKKTQVQKHQFWVKRGLQQNVFCMNLCFAKCEKLSFFLGHFLANFGWCSKGTIKIGIWAHF